MGDWHLSWWTRPFVVLPAQVTGGKVDSAYPSRIGAPLVADLAPLAPPFSCHQLSAPPRAFATLELSTFCASRWARFPAAETEWLPAMSAAETEQMVANLAIDNGAGDETPAAATCCTSEAPPVDDMAIDVSTADKENKEVRQRGCDAEDPGFEPTLTTRVPIRGGQANGNHLNEAVNGAASFPNRRQRDKATHT